MSQKKARQQRQEQRKVLKRKNQEIRVALAEQLRLLEKRCGEFDGGDWGEAVDIATRLRVIFHTGGKSKSPSILQSLDAEKVQMLSTIEYRGEDSDNLIAITGGLYSQRFGRDDTGSFYELRPPLGESFFKFEVPALQWWKGIVEIKGDEVNNPGRHVYRRVDVVKGIAEHDGGAHLASRIPESHDVLTRPGGLVRLTIGEEGNTQEVPIVGVHLAMLRQIAYETLNSPALRALAEPRQDVAEGA